MPEQPWPRRRPVGADRPVRVEPPAPVHRREAAPAPAAPVPADTPVVVPVHLARRRQEQVDQEQVDQEQVDQEQVDAAREGTADPARGGRRHYALGAAGAAAGVLAIVLGASTLTGGTTPPRAPVQAAGPVAGDRPTTERLSRATERPTLPAQPEPQPTTTPAPRPAAPSPAAPAPATATPSAPPTPPTPPPSPAADSAPGPAATPADAATSEAAPTATPEDTRTPPRRPQPDPTATDSPTEEPDDEDGDGLCVLWICP